MSARIVALASALVIAGGSATAAVAARSHRSMSVGSMSRDSLRPGPDSARIAKLLSSLGAGDPLVCELIADQVGNFWNSGDEDGVGRFADVEQLSAIAAAKDSLHGHVANPGAIRLLVSTLATDNACVRRLAAKMLGRSRISADELTKLLDSPSPRTREAAAYAIGVGEVKSARGALEARLVAGAEPEAPMAAWALGEIEDSASVGVLERAAKSQDLRVRLASVDALGNIKDDRTLPTLESLLAHDANARVRARAAGAIGDLGHASSVPVLSAAIDDAAPEVRYAAVRAFDDLHDVNVAPPALIRAARSDDAKLRRLAGLSLAEIHDPASLEALLGLVDSSDRDVRRKVAEALGEIGSPKASAGLLRLIKDPDADVRRAATEALGEVSRRSQ